MRWSTLRRRLVAAYASILKRSELRSSMRGPVPAGTSPEMRRDADLQFPDSVHASQNAVCFRVTDKPLPIAAAHLTSWVALPIDGKPTFHSLSRPHLK